MRKADIAALPHWPRGLSRDQAAAYVGLSPNAFDELVAAREMPAPIRFGRRIVWDRAALDLAFDRLSGISGIAHLPAPVSQSELQDDPLMASILR